MSPAPKSAEAKAASLAKRRESTRTRPIKELRESIRELGKRFAYAEGHRDDLAQLGRIIEFAAMFVTEKRASGETTEAIGRIARALLDLADRPQLGRQVGVFDVDGHGLRDLMKAIEARLAVAPLVAVSARTAPSSAESANVIDFAAAAKRIRTLRSEERRREP